MAIERFFEYRGFVGEGDAKRAYTFVAYRVPGQSAWFMKGRYMVDFDGAPNCYHLTNSKVLPVRDYPTVDIMSWDGVLDYLGNAKAGDGTWASVVLDANGAPIVQGDDDPFPGFLVSTTPLQNDQVPATSPARYADARYLPYVAMPAQIIAQQGPWLKMIGSGHTGNFGDSVTAVNLDTNDCCHAIIADSGNKPEFGEGSYALGKGINLLGGTFEPEVLYIVWPGSGAGPLTMPDPEVVQAAGESLFTDFGGIEQALRLATEMG